MKNNVYILEDYRKERNEKNNSIFKDPIDNSIKEILDLNEKDKETLEAMRKIVKKEIIFD
jgi:TPP-dependent pyruvate/acetoin dehydrogenase alpha subunit